MKTWVLQRPTTYKLYCIDNFHRPEINALKISTLNLKALLSFLYIAHN